MEIILVRMNTSSLIVCHNCNESFHNSHIIRIEWDDSSYGGTDSLCEGCFRDSYTCRWHRSMHLDRVYIRPGKCIGCFED